MAEEVKKLVETDTKGNPVTAYGKIDDAAMQQTLDLAKTYIKLTDSVAAERLASLTLDDIRDASYFDGHRRWRCAGLPKRRRTIQLKWMRRPTVMAAIMSRGQGYYKDAGLK